MKTITICGSARFEHEFKLCRQLLTMNGVIAIGLGSYPSDHGGEKTWYTPVMKELFDLVHLGRVTQADCILVVDCSVEPSPNELSSYVGYSAAREILWATINEVPVLLLSELLEATELRIEQAMSDLVSTHMLDTASMMTLSRCSELLQAALGRETVVDSQRDTHFNVMHAVLSASVCAPDTKSQLDLRHDAANALDFIGLDPMDGALATAYLNMVGSTSSNVSANGVPIPMTETTSAGA